MNVETGQRTELSDFGRSLDGPLGVEPYGVAKGRRYIYVIDASAGTASRGVLFRIDPERVFGNRSVLSDFSNPDQGPLGVDPRGVAVEAGGAILVAVDEASGAILVVDSGVRTDQGLLFRIDPFMGARTILGNFNDGRQGPLGADPAGVAVLPGVPPAVAGCVEVHGGPVSGAAVRFTQPDVAARTKVTDADGCLRFNTAVSGRDGTLRITLPPFP